MYDQVEESSWESHTRRQELLSKIIELHYIHTSFFIVQEMNQLYSTGLRR